MKLSRNGQIVLSALFVASLVLGGAGFAQAKATQIAYQEQTKQIKLYKDELNEVQGQLQEYTKYKVNVWMLKGINWKHRLKNFLNEKLLASL